MILCIASAKSQIPVSGNGARSSIAVSNLKHTAVLFGKQDNVISIENNCPLSPDM